MFTSSIIDTISSFFVSSSPSSTFSAVISVIISSTSSVRIQIASCSHTYSVAISADSSTVSIGVSAAFLLYYSVLHSRQACMHYIISCYISNWSYVVSSFSFGITCKFSISYHPYDMLSPIVTPAVSPAPPTTISAGMCLLCYYHLEHFPKF